MCLQPAEEEDDRKIDNAKELQITPCILPAIAHPIQLSCKLDDLVHIAPDMHGIAKYVTDCQDVYCKSYASQSQISKQPRWLVELYVFTVLSLMSVIQHAKRPSTVVSTGI